MYGISTRQPDQSTAWIKSDAILGMLDAANPAHQPHIAHIARINEIERKGIRYSNEDFDVLSAAYSAARA